MCLFWRVTVPTKIGTKSVCELEHSIPLPLTAFEFRIPSLRS
jgi:hypothetical protein